MLAAGTSMAAPPGVGSQQRGGEGLHTEYGERYTYRVFTATGDVDRV